MMADCVAKATMNIGFVRPHAVLSSIITASPTSINAPRKFEAADFVLLLSKPTFIRSVKLKKCQNH